MAAFKGFLTVIEAADRMGVSASRVYQFIAKGRLKVVRFGGKALLVDAQSVRAFIRRPRGRPRTRKETKGR